MNNIAKILFNLSAVILFTAGPTFSQSTFWQQTSLDSGRVWELETNSHGDIFAGVWTSVGHSSYRLYRSTNSGDSWDSLALGFPNPLVWDLLIVSNLDSPGGYEEIFASIERGASTDTTYDGIYYSSDNGSIWERRSPERFLLGLITPDSGRTFFGGGNLSGRGGVNRSIDGGRTWTKLTPPYCGPSGGGCPENICGNPPVGSITITRQGTILGGHDLRCGEPYSVHRSSDNGQIWTRHTTWSPSGASVEGFLVPSLGDIFLIANDGVNRSSYDGATWSPANNGIPPWAAETMHAIAMDSSGTMYVADRTWGPTNGGGIFRSTDNGNSWVQWNSGLPNIGIYSLEVNPYGYIFVGGSRSGVFRSARPVGAVLAANPEQIIFPQIPVGTNVTDSFTVYSKNTVPLIITSATSTDPAFTVFPDSITIIPGDSALFYVTFTPDSVRQYTGEIVLEYNGRLSPDSILVYGDAVIPVELISFTANVVGGKVELEWSTATETNNSGFEILRYTQNDNEWKRIGFVPGFGTTTEYKSYSFTDDLTLSHTLTLQYRLKQIDFDGTFKYSHELEVDVDYTPKEFVLYQNYPNPFNPITKIKYEIPGQARNDNVLVTLKVYDVLGNEVATLVDEEKEPGVYEINFNAENLSSGIYFYRLRADNFSQTKKLVLMR